MTEDHRANQERSAWWLAMFRDAQFWVPLAVLAGGLILLRAIE